MDKKIGDSKCVVRLIISCSLLAISLVKIKQPLLAYHYGNAQKRSSYIDSFIKIFRVTEYLIQMFIFIIIHNQKLNSRTLGIFNVPLINYGQITCRFQIPDKYITGWIFVQIEEKW